MIVDKLYFHHTRVKSERCSKNIFNKTVGQTLNSVSRMINIDTARQLVKLLENDP